MKAATLTLFLSIICFLTFGQTPTLARIKMPDDIRVRIDNFIKKEKFNADNDYPGLEDESLKQGFTDLINLAAKDFLTVALSNPTEKKFQDQIKVGLNRFSKKYQYIDSEDEDKICHYFEEIMDIVGLQSSGGHLNMWRYGFDPTKKP
jgi:hypothetical protein